MGKLLIQSFQSCFDKRSTEDGENHRIISLTGHCPTCRSTCSRPKQQSLGIRLVPVLGPESSASRHLNGSATDDTPMEAKRQPVQEPLKEGPRHRRQWIADR